jgi:hypothetical protein
MRIFIGEMFENRAYRAYSKAVRRLNPQLEHMKEIFSPVRLDGEKFDDILVTFVDAPEGYYHEVKNRDRMYHVEMAVAEMPSYKPPEDEALLLKIAAQLREVMERAPVRESTRAELLKRFSKWESAIRQQSMRAV